MLALVSVWLALLSFVLSLTMLVYRPAFTDVTLTLVLYFGAPGAMCLAGLTLWAHRDEDAANDPGLAGRRVQSKTAIALAIAAAAIVYGLIICSNKLNSSA
ncbi:MAG: hypothetical protein HY287_12055 [Planctomycetes bacterium]|nr:hypothetical protein [Planctomycetota bacterium]